MWLVAAASFLLLPYSCLGCSSPPLGSATQQAMYNARRLDGGTPTAAQIDVAANAQRVKRLLPSSTFSYLFPRANKGTGPQPGNGPYTYDNFITAVTKWPAFCNDGGPQGLTGTDLDNLCLKELATLFAMWAQETGENNPSSNVPTWRQALYEYQEIGCERGCPGYRGATCDSPLAWQSTRWPCPPGVEYFGRGAHQLSYNYNYGLFSEAIFGDVSVLLSDPGLVVASNSNGWLAFASAIWFHMTPQSPKPSGHDALVGWWVPNAADVRDGRNAGFGVQIMIINGGVECIGAQETTPALNRISCYLSFCQYLGIAPGDNLHCTNMGQFNANSSASMDTYWDQAWVQPCSCRLVSHQTGWSVFDNSGNPNVPYCKCVAASNFPRCQDSPAPAGSPTQGGATCQTSSWGSWSACTVTCGSGQTTRTRSVTSGAAGCAATSETAACNTNACGGTTPAGLDLYEGCWGDDNARTMTSGPKGTDYLGCRNHAISMNAPWFALQYGNECFYALESKGFQRLGPVTACNMMSTDGKLAGGWWANSVYRIAGTTAPAWTVFLSKGTFGSVDMGASATNNMFKPGSIIRRQCMNCNTKELYYKRISAVPAGFSIYDMMKSNWNSKDNALGLNFQLYGSYEDLLADTNRFSFCNYDDAGIGFPRDCGRDGPVWDEWNSWSKGGQPNVAFSISSPIPGTGGIVPYSTPQNDAANVVFLDRHWVYCPAGQALSRFQLTSTDQWVRYVYECSIAPLGTCFDRATAESDDGGGNADFLDRQSVQCLVGEVLTGFVLSRPNANSNKIFYRYRCCNAFAVTHGTYSTPFGPSGGGNVRFLDRHNVQCPAARFLRSFSLKRDPPGTGFQYLFSCSGVARSVSPGTSLQLATYDACVTAQEDLSVVVYPCRNVLATQKWIYADFRFRSAAYPNLCLANPGDSNTGYNLLLRLCSGGGGNQRFTWVGNELKDPSGYCVDVSGGVGGSKLITWQCQGNPNQRWTTDGDGTGIKIYATPRNEDLNTIYLDRHSVYCPPGQALWRFQLLSSEQGISYVYECSVAPLGACYDRVTAETLDGGGNADFLDRQNVQCNAGEVLTGFVLSRQNANSNKIFYNYRCCTAALVTSESYSTPFGPSGGGNVRFLDRHNVQCPVARFITSFTLGRDPPGTGIRYLFSCAGVAQSGGGATCQTSSWGSWSACTVTCGSGQMTRTRSITSGAAGCAATSETVACNTNACGGSLSPGARKFTADVLQRLSGVTGISDPEVWANIMGISAKAEQNQGPDTWDLTDRGTSVFAYAEALEYDWQKRGVTAGLVGFTSANDGKEEWGDMQKMLELYNTLSGRDLRPQCAGTTRDRSRAQALVSALQSAGSDRNYILAQWQAITDPQNPGAYLHHALRILRARGFSNPQPLTVATGFDHALNCGVEGTYGWQWMVDQVPRTITDEQEFLRYLSERRIPVLGLNDFNFPPINGQRRAEIIIKILDAGCMNLKGCDATIRNALDYVLQ